MSKYDPLTEFLRGKAGHEIRMTFAEIENVLGYQLPQKSKALRAWWSNNPSNNVMTRAWLAAGYKTAQVDVAGEVLTFVPSGRPWGFGEMHQTGFEDQPSAAKRQTEEVPKTPARHPAFGVWKGLVTLDPDYDYTQPADPDWGKVYEQ